MQSRKEHWLRVLALFCVCALLLCGCAQERASLVRPTTTATPNSGPLATALTIEIGKTTTTAPTTPTVPTTAARKPTGKLYWEITDKANKGTLFLLAAPAVGTAELYPLPDDIVFDYYDSSILAVMTDVIAMEYDSGCCWNAQSP